MNLPAGDAAWTTKQVAAYLGITRGKVADTLRRWGVEALPHGVTSGNRGFSRAYSVAEVVEADRNRPGKRRAEKPLEDLPPTPTETTS